MFQKILDWAKRRPLLAAAIVVSAVWLVMRMKNSGNDSLLVMNSVENFSTCYQRKQIYLNSVDPDNPTGMADCNIEKQFGKLYIKIMANLPYARGGVFSSHYGAYSCFLVASGTGKSINLGGMVRGGDRFYRLFSELAGQYDEYDTVQVWLQVEDYKPKLILSGSITEQQNSSL